MSKDPTWTREQDARDIREGIITGLLGACIVAAFYLVVDLVRGIPLLTPSVLGQVLILHDQPTMQAIDTTAVMLYTGFHVVAFVAFGLLLVALTRTSERSNVARIAVIQIFVAFEVFFYGVLAVASVETRGLFPLLGVLSANTLAGAGMALFLWRHHPALRLVSRMEPIGAKEIGASASVHRA